MRCPSDLTDMPHGPTPCTPDATLYNYDPTLHRRGRTCLPVELTERLIERTSLASVRTLSARHDTEGMYGLTAGATRLTTGDVAITPHAARSTALAKHVTSCARRHTVDDGQFTARQPSRTRRGPLHTKRCSMITIGVRQSTFRSLSRTAYRRSPTRGMMILTSSMAVYTRCERSARNLAASAQASSIVTFREKDS